MATPGADYALQPARALLFEWTLARYLATRPPSHVVVRCWRCLCVCLRVALHARRACSWQAAPHSSHAVFLYGSARAQTIQADDTIGAALSLFRRHKILSAPVVDARAGNDVVGIFSVIDAVTTFLAGAHLA
jgi:hypothetical protein